MNFQLVGVQRDGFGVLQDFSGDTDCAVVTPGATRLDIKDGKGIIDGLHRIGEDVPVRLIATVHDAKQLLLVDRGLNDIFGDESGL